MRFPAELLTPGAIRHKASSSVKDVMSIAGGHVGAVVGSRAAKELYPRLRTWLDKHGAVTQSRQPESRL